MNIETLREYGDVIIEVLKKGFGIEKGVYIVGEDLKEDLALRLLNNNNAVITEYNYESSEQSQTQVDSDSGTSSEASSDLETGRDQGNEQDPTEEGGT